VVWTIVVAAGTGARFGSAKQFERLGHQRVLDWAVAAAQAASDGVVVVLQAGLGAVAGGATRSASVRNGLGHVPDGVDIICVHDAARPLATPALFARVVAAVEAGADAAVPGLPVADTIQQVAPDGTVVATLDRSALRAVQTPQAFRAEVLRRAHRDGAEGTDDAALVEAVGGRVVVVDGDEDNRKLTVAADLAWARLQVAS
jgi:2-C-methyl-D-erythritol 4-phosphate cytidylyltransferase